MFRRLALCLLAAVTAAAPLDDIIGTARKALANEGVATAWKLTQQALADAPGSAPAHELAGEIHFRRGEIPEAETEFRAAVKLDSNFAPGWWGLARVADSTARYREAKDNFAKAHELAPDDPRIFRDWALHLKGQSQINALERLVSIFDPVRQAAELDDLRQRIVFDRAQGIRLFNVLASRYEKSETAMLSLVSANHIRSFGLEVIVNGTPFRLILDTGASGVMIPRRLAEKAGVARLADATFRGFGDNRQLLGGYRGVAREVRIGDIVFRDALISVSGQESVGTADGLIGADVFAEFLVTLDFPARMLRLTPLAGHQPDQELLEDHPAEAALIRAHMGNPVSVYRFGHLLLVPGRVADSRAGLFVLDSGSERTLLSYEMASGTSNVDRDDRTGFRGLSGKVADVYKTGDLAIEFAGFRQKNLGMTAFDLWGQSRAIGTEISGFLGLPVLELFSLTIDYRDGIVSFERPVN